MESLGLIFALLYLQRILIPYSALSHLRENLIFVFSFRSPFKIYSYCLCFFITAFPMPVLFSPKVPLLAGKNRETKPVKMSLSCISASFTCYILLEIVCCGQFDPLFWFPFLLLFFSLQVLFASRTIWKGNIMRILARLISRRKRGGGGAGTGPLTKLCTLHLLSVLLTGKSSYPFFITFQLKIYTILFAISCKKIGGLSRNRYRNLERGLLRKTMDLCMCATFKLATEPHVEFSFDFETLARWLKGKKERRKKKKGEKGNESSILVPGSS